jgi:hypothetical protein
MKNCMVKLSLFSAYRLTLQITNVMLDKTTGVVKNATAWTNFNDPNLSTQEYKTKSWTVDQWQQNPEAVKEVYEMIEIQNKYDNNTLSMDEALALFKAHYDVWVERHKTVVPKFVEKTIVGLNRSSSLSETCEKVVNFFKDVPGFHVAARFINTLCFRVKEEGREGAIEFVNGYFSLQGKRDEADNIIAKMGAKKAGSPEWDEIEAGLSIQNPKTVINKRLKIYYGAQGTGKTTKAIDELDDKSNIIVCNAAMDSNDMLFDFDFDKDGKPVFRPGKLYRACEEGKTILLDEINLLNDEVLRFLQGITDNKSTFTAKGHEIHVKDGFMIIGTMNLTVNGQVFPLPEPLIDRASELKEFTMDASMLEAALM